MTSLEDIGFQSFIARDTVGAVSVSGSEMWIGGALAVGAVVGAVYAYPKRFEETQHDLHQQEKDTEYVIGNLSMDEAVNLYRGRELKEGSNLERYDQQRRLEGMFPANMYSNGDHLEVVYKHYGAGSTGIPRDWVPTSRVDDAMEGEYSNGDIDRLKQAGFGIGRAVPLQRESWDEEDMSELRFVPARCMIHRECRENPKLGEACLMREWDERWRGSK